ncbi:hypothetical protein [Serratia ureilytica]|uniref:hypothetical protein n=1 Tax=Serratia ureilytica TaxID=300181 RepID=UPI00191FD68F|nr:hypothetical protein [Serratia ureilytica]MBL0877040.1 hypothetical protein [Serratia ureilytica]MDN2469299.1 hypothetical protein [Serratia ureilytica]
MGRMTASLIDACALVASYAQAGFNGNQNIPGNQGRGNGVGGHVGQCLKGRGKVPGNIPGKITARQDLKKMKRTTGLFLFATRFL